MEDAARKFTGEQDAATMTGALGDAARNTSAYLGDLHERAKKEEQAKTTKLEYSSEGDRMKVEGASATIMEHLQKSKAFDQIQKIWEKQQLQKEAQIQNIKSHPFQNVLAEIAASMAKNDPNPYTRGLGEAAQRLNPTVSQLEGERGVALHEQTEVLKTQDSLDMKLAQILNAEQRIDIMGQLAKSREAEQAEHVNYMRTKGRVDELEAGIKRDKEREEERHHKTTEAEADKKLQEKTAVDNARIAIQRTLAAASTQRANAATTQANAATSRAKTYADTAGKSKVPARTAHQIEQEISAMTRNVSTLTAGTRISVDPEGDKKLVADSKARIEELKKEKERLGKGEPSTVNKYADQF
jgi:hypothetical protein